MRSNSKKSKKSTTKYRDFKISPLIPVIALIEVLVLIGVSTFAWFKLSANKQLGSGTISVKADSGLDIDFQYANKEDYINIWNYVDKNFEFEPVTSLDGRNVFVPTSGTFGNQETGNMVFRDGTVNDINSKYLNIDFELTNTSGVPIEVYLNNNSYFRVKDSSSSLGESRALRLAFYPNNGEAGNVGSSLIHNSSNTSTDGDTETESVESTVFYFDTVQNTSWSRVYAYFYNSSNNSYLKAWPGTEMSHDNGKIYSLSLPNDSLTGYDKVVFSNGYGGSNNQTANLTTANVANKLVNKGGTVYEYIPQTIYFLKPSGWNRDTNSDGVADVYCHTYVSDSETYTSGYGDLMDYVGSGIYSYTFYYAYKDGSTTTQNVKKLIFDSGAWNGNNQTEKVTIGANTGDSLYYVSGGTGNSNYTVNSYSKKYTALTYKTVYFSNTYVWNNPYAVVSLSTAQSLYSSDLPMVSLSGNVYYCTIPEFYDKVYFRAKNQGTNPDLRSENVASENGRVYRPVDTTEMNTGYHLLESFVYSNYILPDGYPVISPGVSVGFQRAYTPIVNIDNYSGAATEVIPAFANSIDNYIYGVGSPVFTIQAGHMLSLSMVIWLEGTDESTNGSTYPAHNIELKLEFATLTKKSQAVPPGTDVPFNQGESEYFTYNFYDRTREIWTSDRRATESGITVAPVMQLYDETIKRGYLMHPKEYTTYNGKSKVSLWTVSAPASIATLGHDINFRRVNPYDEEEVWNYWYAGRVAGESTDAVPMNSNGNPANYAETTTRYEPYTIAKSTSGGNTYISFTAFADGSPLPSMPGLSSDTDSVYKVPNESCGGLWGNHPVRTVAVLDGLRGQPLKDSDGVLTINYNYKYNSTDGERPVRIEYKASPAYNSFYYFIIPNAVFANETQCAFKRYTGFDGDYAINSAEKNPNITFAGKYYGKDTTISGDYFELNEKTGGYNTDYSYWGSDVLYIQTNGDTKNHFYTSSSSNDSNARLFQVDFYDNSNHNRYAYLYYNGNFKSSDGDGFACVVPNDKDYTYYKIENCSFTGTVYNTTSAVQVKSADNVTVTSPSITNYGTTASRSMRVKYVDNHGVKATHISIRIFIQTTHAAYGKDPHCYVYNSASNSYPNGCGYPGAGTTYRTTVDGMRKYEVNLDVNPCKYDRIIFVYADGTSDSAAITLAVKDAKNNMVYESKGNSGNAGLVSSGDNDVIKTESFDPSWPHLTFKS